jgi:hypothetical protein
MARAAEHDNGAVRVLYADDDHAVPYQPRGVIVVALAGDEGAAVDPHHDRKAARAGRGACWSVDVQVEAVLRRAGHAEPRRRLRAVRRERRSIADPGPWSGGLRGTPAQRAYRRSGVRNAEELIHRASRRAAERPISGGYDQSRAWCGRSRTGAGRRGASHEGGEDDEACGEPDTSPRSAVISLHCPTSGREMPIYECEHWHRDRNREWQARNPAIDSTCRETANWQRVFSDADMISLNPSIKKAPVISAGLALSKYHTPPRSGATLLTYHEIPSTKAPASIVLTWRYRSGPRWS